MIELKLLGVQVELPSNSPLLLLREVPEPGRVLPVVIDTPEAEAIHRGIEGIRMARPLTHDLIKVLLDTFDATLRKVTISQIRNRTFFAEMEFECGDAVHVVSARPSDAVAVAVRADTPIFASDEVMDTAGQIIQAVATTQEDVDPDELLDEFKQFLDDVSPGDFDPSD